MELRDARKINSKELYDRRKQAVLLFEKGLKRYEIAPLVGVSAYTVGQWIKAWKKGGQAALKVGNKGRPRGLYRKLLPHEEREIRRAITDRCPDQLKLPFALWTRQAVQTLIKQPALIYEMTPKTKEIRNGLPYPEEYRKICREGANLHRIKNHFIRKRRRKA